MKILWLTEIHVFKIVSVMWWWYIDSCFVPLKINLGYATYSSWLATYFSQESKTNVIIVSKPKFAFIFLLIQVTHKEYSRTTSCISMNMKASMMNIKGRLATIYSHLFKELPVLLGYGLWRLKNWTKPKLRKYLITARFLFRKRLILALFEPR